MLDVQVSDEFIEEGKLCKVVQKKPNAPYSKKDRLARRKEVYRLHIELGYSAVKIADLMKIHRNTINDDIKYLYSKISNQFEDYGYDVLIQKHIIRLETQRIRLMERLDKETDWNRKLALERMIMDLESKLLGITFKVSDSEYSRSVFAVEMANDILKKSKQEKRYYSHWEVFMISKDKRKKITEIIKGVKEK